MPQAKMGEIECPDCLDTPAKRDRQATLAIREDAALKATQGPLGHLALDAEPLGRGEVKKKKI